jgi:hypothetical protein
MVDTAAGSDNARPGSIQEITKGLEAFLDREDDPAPKKAPATKPKAEPEPNDDELAVDPELAPDADEDEDPDKDPNDIKSPEDDEDADPDAQSPESLYTVTIDGKEEQVKASELIAGYQRNQSYTRKSMALAEERKSFETERVSTKQEREEYANLIPRLRAALETKEPDWAKLKAEDPANYASTWADWQQNQAKINSLRLEEQRLSTQKQADYEKARDTVLAEQRNQLLSKLPSWKDPKVAVKEAAEITAVLESLGFSGDDLQIYDHRAVLLARLAAKYQKGLATRSGVTQQRADAAPVLKPGAGPAKKVRAGAAEQKQFNKTGSLKDAAKLFEHFL